VGDDCKDAGDRATHGSVAEGWGEEKIIFSFPSKHSTFVHITQKSKQFILKRASP
jgi:hypothetical protein